MGYQQTRPLHVLYRRTLPDVRPAAAKLGQETSPVSCLWSATIHGDPVPRHGARTVAVIRGVPQLVRSADARSWQNAALSQLLNRRPLRPLSRDLALDCRVWHRRRPDEVDDSLIIDLLERAAIITGARLVVERHLYVQLDPEAPRVEIRLSSALGSGEREGN